MLCHLTLATRNVERTRNFFEQTLGWRNKTRPGNIPMRAAWLEIAPGQELHLVEVADFAPSPFENEFGRHIAVSYPRTEFAALQERLRTLGAEVIDAHRPTPFARFFFRDPNGYMFEVIEA
jgi:catechol 2,3-dioxygenase-like lactoylglutathione lyase family enzyme